MSNILASHIHLFNESFLLSLMLYSETSHRPFHISSIEISTIYKRVRTLSDLRPNSPHHEVTLQPQRRIIRRSLSQSAGFLRARMSDVTHHPMSHITSAHNIPTSNTILNPYLLHISILLICNSAGKGSEIIRGLRSNI